MIKTDIDTEIDLRDVRKWLIIYSCVLAFISGVFGVLIGALVFGC